MSLCTALLALLLTADNPHLAEAERAFEAAQFEQVLPALAAARGSELSQKELARSYELEALVAAAYDDAPAELRAFTSLLALEPDYQLSPAAGPKMVKVFLQAKQLQSPSPQVSTPAIAASVSTRSGWSVGASLLYSPLPVRALGGELLVARGVLDWLDLGAGVVVSGSPGAELFVTAHPAADSLFRPYVQLRGLGFVSRDGLAAGLAAWAGVGVRAGPGRVGLGVGGELYFAPAPFAARSLLFAANYTFELWRFTETAR